VLTVSTQAQAQKSRRQRIFGQSPSNVSTLLAPAGTAGSEQSPERRHQAKFSNDEVIIPILYGVDKLCNVVRHMFQTFQRVTLLGFGLGRVFLVLERVPACLINGIASTELVASGTNRSSVAFETRANRPVVISRILVVNMQRARASAAIHPFHGEVASEVQTSPSSTSAHTLHVERCFEVSCVVDLGNLARATFVVTSAARAVGHVGHRDDRSSRNGGRKARRHGMAGLHNEVVLELPPAIQRVR